jgi:hypothetical protein
MITEQRAEEAFEFLRDSTERIGSARGAYERAEIMRKRVRKRIFVGSEGSVAQREALAEIHEDVINIDDQYIEAVVAFETLRAKRDIETIALDVWRTESANRRRS